MQKAKDILERLESLGNSVKGSGVGFLSEMQELMLLAPDAVQEIYQAEQDMEDMGEMLTAYERGGAA